VDWECSLARFQPLDYGSRGTAAVLVPAVRYFDRRLGFDDSRGLGSDISRRWP